MQRKSSSSRQHLRLQSRISNQPFDSSQKSHLNLPPPCLMSCFQLNMTSEQQECLTRATIQPPHHVWEDIHCQNNTLTRNVERACPQTKEGFKRENANRVQHLQARPPKSVTWWRAQGYQKVAVDVMKKVADVECSKQIPGTDGEVSIMKNRIEWDWRKTHGFKLKLRFMGIRD